MRYTCIPLHCALMFALIPAIGSTHRSEPGDSMSAPAAVKNANKAITESKSSDLYEGIVIDQTLTKNGQEFYRFFLGNWRDQPLADRYTVSVREQPSARFGSQVHVSFGTRRVFQGQLPLNRSQVKILAESAAETTYQAVTEGEMQRLLFKDPDVGQDEI